MTNCLIDRYFTVERPRILWKSQVHCEPRLVGHAREYFFSSTPLYFLCSKQGEQSFALCKKNKVLTVDNRTKKKTGLDPQFLYHLARLYLRTAEQ